jgi:hypothetical protein
VDAHEVTLVTEYARLTLQVSWTLFPTHPLKLTEEERRLVDQAATIWFCQALWWTRSAAFAACLAVPAPATLPQAARPPEPAPAAASGDVAPPGQYL